MTEAAHQTTPKTPTTDTSSTTATANATTHTTNTEKPNAVQYGEPELHPQDFEEIEIDPVLEASHIIELLSEMMDPRYFVTCPNYENTHKLEYKGKEIALNIQRATQHKGQFILTLTKRWKNGKVDNWVNTVKTLNDCMREVINYTA